MAPTGGKGIVARTAVVLVAALLLSACGSRDTDLAEQVAAAQEAARRAEAAQKAAEKAVARLAGQNAVVEEAEPEDPDAERIDETEEFDNTIVTPQAPA